MKNNKKSAAKKPTRKYQKPQIKLHGKISEVAAMSSYSGK